MKIGSNNQPAGRQPISQDVTYQIPVTERVKIGSVPRDYFDQNSTPSTPYTPCENGACENHPRGVWADQPLRNTDGTPVMRSVTRHIEASPASTTWAFVGWGAAAGLAGALTGALVQGPFLSATLGIGGGLVAGYLAADHASKDRVALVWDDKPVVNSTMAGYEEQVSPGRLHGESGYFHRYMADVDREVLTTYRTPRVVHYREGETPQ